MRHLNGIYTQSFNRAKKRTGHVFQGRFKAILVEKESHLLEVARYVVLNPVRAKMVKHPREWKWGSYSATAGEDASPEFLTTEWLLEQFDASLARAQDRYRQFVKEGRGVRLWDSVKGGVLLGTEGFAEQMRPLLQDAVQSKEISREERLLSKPTLAELLQGTEKNKALRDERIYAAVRLHDYTLFQLQEVLGLHYSTISRIVKRVSEGRTSKNKTSYLTPDRGHPETPAVPQARVITANQVTRSNAKPSLVGCNCLILYDGVSSQEGWESLRQPMMLHVPARQAGRG